MKKLLQFRQIGDASAQVFMDVERVGYTKVLSSRGHELHQPHRALRGHYSRLPRGLDLDDCTHKSWRHIVLSSVVACATLLVLAHAERLPSKCERRCAHRGQ